MCLTSPLRTFFVGLIVLLGVLATPVSAQDRVYTLNEVDAPPKLKRRVHIEYPTEVRRKGGEIVLQYVVTAKGQVHDVTVMRVSNPDMIVPACEAYEDARYTPAMKEGKPVAVKIEVTERTGK